jgi:hypothetical protein
LGCHRVCCDSLLRHSRTRLDGSSGHWLDDAVKTAPGLRELDRGQPEDPCEALSADLAHLLVMRQCLSSAEIALLRKEEAITRMNEFWSQPG